MQRYTQTTEELLANLTPIKTKWNDQFSDDIIAAIQNIPQKHEYQAEDVQALLNANFEAGYTVIQLLFDLSKDEFSFLLKSHMGQGGIGLTRYQKDNQRYIQTLMDLGLLDKFNSLINTPLTWRDILAERLKMGRGSAIKGQARGRFLEDFVENIVEEVFTDVGYDVRCRFIGANGLSTEKADFAIPSKSSPHILIEVKAYGATGSKQSDILGDVNRIIQEKRHDTNFLLVTDGVTWAARTNDLRKLVSLQNQGVISRIYTYRMKQELLKDLHQLRLDHSL